MLELRGPGGAADVTAPFLSKAEERELHRAINAACPFHHGKGRLCLHLTLGKIVGALIVAGRFQPTMLPEDVNVREAARKE